MENNSNIGNKHGINCTTSKYKIDVRSTACRNYTDYQSVADFIFCSIMGSITRGGIECLPISYWVILSMGSTLQ